MRWLFILGMRHGACGMGKTKPQAPNPKPQALTNFHNKMAKCFENIRGCDRMAEYKFRLKSSATEDSTVQYGKTYEFCLKHAFLESVRHAYWGEKEQKFIINFSVSDFGFKGLFKKRVIFELFAQNILELIYSKSRDNPKVFSAKTLANGETIKLFGPGINLEKKYTMDDPDMTSFFLSLGGIDDMQTMFIHAEKKEENIEECGKYIKSMLENHTRVKTWQPVKPVSELSK